MKEYWMDDVKKTEKAMYIGHIPAKDRANDKDKDIIKRLSQICSETEGISCSILRDLSDRYWCPGEGPCYGRDVFVIVKNGYLKRNKNNIEKMKKCFN